MISKTEVGVVDDTFRSAGSVHRDIGTFLAYVGLPAEKQSTPERLFWLWRKTF
jgi:hypothetical protein